MKWRIALSLFLLAGCAAYPRYRSAIEQAYSDASPVLVDAEALNGRTIVLDPGHGGGEAGAKGPGGLREKDVNLGVALKLAEFLRKAGVKVVMTRNSDRSLTDGGTREELDARMELVHRARPDLFLSIHHNASLDPASRADETQTYYRMDDLGPSYDAAQAIHRALVRRLGLPTEKLLPGNYLVLRRCGFPAVLGEASFITQPALEKKLSLAENREVEAKAYLQGIQDYFARGVPLIEAGDPPKPSPRPFFTARFIPDRSPIDPASIRCFLDDQPVPFYFNASANTLSSQPDRPLANGEHVFRIEARNVRGNAARSLTTRLTVDEPPARLQIGLPFPAPPKDGPLPVMARVLDASGYPVKDGILVQWKSNAGHFLEAKSLTRGGVATNYLCEVDREPVVISASAGKARSAFTVPNKSDHVLMGRALDPGGQPISGAVITAVGRKKAPMTRTNGAGYFWIYPVPEGLEAVRFEAAGYQLAVVGAGDDAYLEMELVPMHSAPLAGKTVVLNPAEASDWPVATFLEQYLRLAGAKPVFTRLPDQSRDDVDGVRLANRLAAALFLTLGHRDLPGAEHYPASVAGRTLAERIAAELELGRVCPSSSYPLIHTACPGVDVFLPGLLAPAVARREAYRIFQALLPEGKGAATLRIEVSNGNLPAADASLILNETWPGQTDEAGVWRYRRLSPGQYYLTVSDGPLLRSYWVVDLKPGEERTMRIKLDRAEVPPDLGNLNPAFACR